MATLPITPPHWREIKTLFRQSLVSSMHYSIASVTADGHPHVTPIGSLMLGKPGHGIYFEAFTSKLPENIKHNPQVCVLAVNSSKWFWLKSLIKGQFTSPPGVRLHGTAGIRRDATEAEIDRWQQQVQALKWTKGHAAMWSGMSAVREIQFEAFEPIRIGKMTRNKGAVY